MHSHTLQQTAAENKAFIRLELLGGFRFFVGEHDLSHAVGRSAKLKSILCYLILHRAQPVSRDELINIFYEDENQSDPVSALRMQIMRIRQQLKPYFGEDIQPITGRRHTYQWNENLPVWVDAEHFENLCQQADNTGMEAAERCEMYRQALELYDGDLDLAKDDVHWGVMTSVRYHGRFVSAAENYAALLLEQGDAVLAEQICLRVIEREPTDENMYAHLIRALVKQKRYSDAKECYGKLVETLHQTLGVEPTERLKQMYHSISQGLFRREDDLEMVMRDLGEKATRRSAFVCGFEEFRSIYQLEVRRAPRTGSCMHVVMLTVGEDCRTDIERLKEFVVTSLRSGDVVAQYSDTQFIIMLHEADLEDSERVMERVVKNYRNNTPQESVSLNWQIHEMVIQ